MDRILVALLASLTLLAGCTPPEDFSGPHGSLASPKIEGGSSFGDDHLSVTVETFASDQRDEPQIESVKVYANHHEIDADVLLERVQDSAGYYSQKASFYVPTDADSVKAVLIVRHEGQLYEVTAPFVRGSGKTKSE